MPDPDLALPRFAFSRRDPSAILRLVRERLREQGGARLLALGGQPRDRVYCAQLLAADSGHAFVQLDLSAPAVDLASERAALEKALALARATPVTLLLDGAETLFARVAGTPGARAHKLGGYLKRALGAQPGNVVLGMPERVEADYARTPVLDLEVTFRAPSGGVVATRPVLLPSLELDQPLLPAHNFQAEIDGRDIGLCEVSAPRLLAGPYSDQELDPHAGATGFQKLPPELRAAWPTLKLRRAVTRSRLLFDWKQAQYAGKPQLRDVVLHQLDWSGRHRVNTWRVQGCWPRSWSGPAFDAMAAAVAVEEIELYYTAVVWA